MPETTTIKDLQEALSILVVPSVAFKFLIEAARTMDFSGAESTVIRTNYLQALQKVEEHFDHVIYEEMYSSDDYNKFYSAWTKLFAVLETLVNDTLNITDISRQQVTIVVDLLLSYGFDIHQVFDEHSLKLLAKNIYAYLRRKGTPDLIAVLLEMVGFTHLKINEYSINRKDQKWVFVPETVISLPRGEQKLKSRDEYVPFDDVKDPLWWIDRDELDELYIKYYGSLYDYY